MEIKLIYSFNNNIQVNLDFVIMHHMLSHDEKSSGLPHARFISKMFKFFKIETKDKLRVKMPPKECEINIDVVKNKMRVSLDPEDRLYKHVDDENAKPSSHLKTHVLQTKWLWMN